MKKVFKGFKKGMKDFGDCITIIVNTVLLLIVYLIGVGITSIVAKIIGKKFLDKYPANEKSYWTDINIKKESIEDYHKQF